jgi:hypothetical protein
MGFQVLKVNIHPTEDELEDCLLDRISEVSRRGVEEHLLVCETCRDALEDIHATILARNWALADIVREERTRKRRSFRFIIPARVYAGYAAALVALLGWTYLAHRDGPVRESEVSLTAMRSGVTGDLSFATAGSNVTLHLDTTSLPSEGRYLVEVVGATGHSVWAEQVAARTPSVTTRITKPVPAGRYWVRLNTTAGVPLREYELRVQ